MRKLALYFAVLVLVPVFAVSVRAQEAAKDPGITSRPEAAKTPAHFYRLDFVIEDLDSAGKPTNSRSFSTTVSTVGSRSGSFTVGSKIPLVAGSEAPKTNPNAALTQFQYIDVGIKITASEVREIGNHLAFYLHTEVSSTGPPVVLAGVSEPVFRQNVWNGDILIPVGKEVVAFRSDSLDNKGSMLLQVKATPEE